MYKFGKTTCNKSKECGNEGCYHYKLHKRDNHCHITCNFGGKCEMIIE